MANKLKIEIFKDQLGFDSTPIDGKKVREFRHSLGLSQSDFAGVLGMPPYANKISTWENDKTPEGHYSTLIRLAMHKIEQRGRK